MNAIGIIKSVSRQYGITTDTLRNGSGRGRSCKQVSCARHTAIHKLRDAGLSLGQIANVMQISYSTVTYHVYETRRAQVAAHAILSKKRKANSWDQRSSSNSQTPAQPI